MDQQWSQYAESPLTSRQARYAPHTQGQQQGSSNQNSAVPSRAASMDKGSTQPRYNGDGDGDIQMEDADPYNKSKVAGRSGHQRMHSAQLIQQEESTAARRYSPMNLSPSSPYSATPQQSQGHFAAFTPHMQLNSQSPTRASFHASSNHGYYSPPGKSCIIP